MGETKSNHDHVRGMIDMISTIPKASWSGVGATLIIFTAASIAITIANATQHHVVRIQKQTGAAIVSQDLRQDQKAPIFLCSVAAAGTLSIAAAFLRTDKQKQESLQKLYTGKYILLKAYTIYGGKFKVPLDLTLFMVTLKVPL